MPMSEVLPYLIVIGLVQLTIGALFKERGLMWTTLVALIGVGARALWDFAPGPVGNNPVLEFGTYAWLVAGVLVLHVLVSGALVNNRQSVWN